MQALQDVLDHQEKLESFGARRWISDAGERLKAFAAAIIAATAGYSPCAEKWGSLRARDFLNIAQDVTTWSLTNFENFKAPCPATVYYHTWAPFLPPIFLFAASHLPAWTTDKPERSMRLCVNPDERRNAFWISLALLAANHLGMPRTGCPVDRQARRQIFKGQNPAELAWLVSRMQHWPEKHKNPCWVAAEELLSRLPTAVCEAVK